jgi:voltage-gated potassium channel
MPWIRPLRKVQKSKASERRTLVERAAIEGALLTWLTARSPAHMVGAVAGVILFGAVGYMAVGGVGFIDGLYMAVITVSTVGYGDLVEGDAGRLFSVFYIVLGVGVVSLTISTFAAALVAGRVGEVFGRRRMEKMVETLSDHLVLCGYGRFGQIAAGEIMEKDVALVVIDKDPDRVQEAEEHGLLAIHGDATEEETLERAGIQRARGLLCALPSDAENVYAILNAREYVEKIQIVALARDRSAEKKLHFAGADHVISPYSIGAHYMARTIVSPHLAQVFNLAAGAEEGLKQVGVRLDEFPVQPGSSLIGVALKDSPIRSEFGMMLVAVIDPDGTRHFNPGPDIVMRENSVLVSIGPMEGMKKLMAACSSPASNA